MSYPDHDGRPPFGPRRRDVLRGAAMAAAAGALRWDTATARTGGARGTYPQGVPWVSMRGNRQNTGSSPLVGFTFTSNSKTPILAAADTNAQGLSLINATPIIGADDTVYVGSSNNHFYSFAPRSGQAPAVIAVNNIVDSAGCFVSPDSFYFPCGDFSLWQAATGGATTATQHKMTTDGGSPSTIHWFEGNVVTDVNNQLYAGNDDFYLYCCTQGASGQYPVWLFATGFYIWSACAFSHDHNTMYFCSADMTLYALDISTPTAPVEKWTFETGNMNTASVAVDANNVVYFGSFDGKIYAVNGSTGAQLWVHATKSLIYPSPAIGPDGLLYITAADGTLRALNTADGSVAWEFFTGMPGFSSAALGPDPAKLAAYLIYIGTGNGKLLALDPKGNRRWSYDISALYSQGSDPADPAFWSSFRYPQINSSVAIGKSGIATATSGGKILWVDYLYYTTSPLPAGIDLSPQDDYVGQLDGSPRFCYVSPSGRMAETVLAPPGGATTQLPVYPAEFISLTYLVPVSGKGGARASFAPIPTGVQVTTSDNAKVKFRISADQTQIYIAPIARAVASRTFTITAGGQAVAEFTAAYRSVPNPVAATDVPGTRLLMQQPSFFAPFVVPALDQLGLATITLPFKVINFTDASTGALWAYGYESYNAGAAGSPTRNLLYVFTGTYDSGNLVLASSSSYFELTSFPTPVTSLKMTGVLSTDKSAALTGLSLSAEYQSTPERLVDWLCQLFTHWIGNIPGVGPVCEVLGDDALRNATIARYEAEFSSVYPGETRFRGRTPVTANAVEVWLRILYFLGRIALTFETFLADWQLFDATGAYTWIGTYALGDKTGPQTLLPQSTAFNWDSSTFTLTATLQYGSTPPAGAVVGIVVLGSDGVPLPLNYTDTNLDLSGTAEGTTLTQAIDLKGVTLTGCTAVVFVNLEMVTQQYTF